MLSLISLATPHLASCVATEAVVVQTDPDNCQVGEVQCVLYTVCLCWQVSIAIITHCTVTLLNTDQ